ncbi:hypothetical protein myaer102_20670 [Microcystis viridis NIES-102]|uniref:PEP-CTERM protein-sorting domain-containing protein n=1 Tax=Microcystis viridis NIES-102 TaxID=213615 RepID=A0A3G9K309_MICVR|nr:hypothetical protein myaer102_20670 [Microcystis viridis NIES-102]
MLIGITTVPSYALTLIGNNDQLALYGKLRENFTTLTGTTSSVLVNLGNGLEETGEISFALDPSGNSYFDYDFDAGTASAYLELLATFPLQQSIGADPIKIVISESGNITETLEVSTVLGDVVWEAYFNGTITQPGGTPQSTNGRLDATSPQTITTPILTVSSRTILFGGGTVLSGPFAGVKFFNSNFWFQKNTNTNETNTCNLIIRPKLLQNNVIPDCQAIPEPTSTLSLLSLGILGAGATLKRKVKRSHSTEKEPSNVG